MVSRKGKTEHYMTKTLFLLLLIQLLHLTWAEKGLETLTPYGSALKDKLIQIQGMGLNSSFDVHLDVPFKYTGKIYDTIHIMKNGVIMLGGAHPEDEKKLSPWENVPQSLPLPSAHPLIAAYWTDPQVTQEGNIWFRQTMHSKELDNIKRKVECLYPQNKDLVAKWGFVATWEDVSSQGDPQLTNTFQLVLANIEDYSYLLFQYGNLTWNSGKMSENGTTATEIKTAVAGYNGGDGISYSMLPGSTSKDIMKIQDDSNVDVPDLWIFRVDQSQEPCVMKGLALMLLLVVLLTLLVGIVIGLVIAWCFWKWKHKLNDYEDLDAEMEKDPYPVPDPDPSPESETPDSDRRDSFEGQESTEEFMFILDPAVSSVTLKPLYTSDANVDPTNKPEDNPPRKLTVIKKH